MRIERQSGAALMVLVVGLGLAAGLGMIISVTMPPPDTDSRWSTAIELQKAKQALLAYAISYADNYPQSGAGVGHFPCPDRDPVNDGIPTNDGPDPPCGRVNTNVGRMPRYTFSRDAGSSRTRKKLIEFYPPKSLMDQQMWYVVSSTFINNPLNRMVNPDTVAELTVDRQDDVVAVIIAPGPELTEFGQQRPSEDITDYVEGENADGDLVFSTDHSTGGNDQLVYITTSELMPLIKRRVAGFVVDWLEDHQLQHCGDTDRSCYPETVSASAEFDSLSQARHWFVRNGWPEYVSYQMDERCQRGLVTRCQVTMDAGTAADQGISVSVRPRDPDV